MDFKRVLIFGGLLALLSASYGYFAGAIFTSLDGEVGKGYCWFVLVFVIPFLLSLCLYTLLSRSLSGLYYQNAVAVLILSYFLSYVAVYIVTDIFIVNTVSLFELVFSVIALCVGTELGKMAGIVKNA